jgi:hypothetical protein
VEPAGLLPGLLGAEEAGTETVNGTAANHYTFDERALLESAVADTTGEVWLASDGGYVLKLTRSTTAGTDYFGGASGSMTWQYDLTEINQPLDMALPAGCQIDAPAMPDAANLVVLPRSMGFDTASSVADIRQFYGDELAARGWTPSGEPLVAPDSLLIAFAKGGEVMQVMATPAEAGTGTHVDVLLSKSE